MMKRKYFLKDYGVMTLFLLTFALTVRAQQIAQISGTVVNTDGELQFGNALALSPIDSSLIAGVSFMEEPFLITGLQAKEVLLKLTSFQFNDTIIRLTYSGSPSIDLGKITLGIMELEEVQVIAQAPLYRNRAGGTVEVNVANTILASSNSLTEILSRSPNVMVNEEGISVFGRGEAVIYLNGVRITNERLASISATQIDKIEIIPNPSSKYDAEGQAVINIRTKTNELEGINTNVSQSVTASDFIAAYTNTNLDVDYRKGKWSLVGGYGLQLGKNRDILNTTRSRTDFRSEIFADWVYDYRNMSNYNLGAQYDLNSKNRISIEYAGFANDLGGTYESTNDIRFDGRNTNLAADTDKNNKTYNNSVSLNFRRQIDSLGSSLFVGGQFSYYDSDTDDRIQEQLNGQDTVSARSVNNLVELNIPVLALQADYTRYLNEQDKLDLGLRTSYVESEADSRFLIAEQADNFILDEDLSNYFRYKEQIFAGYLDYSGMLNERTDFRIGIRSELTNYELNTNIDFDQDVTDTYINFFPNASLSSKITEKTRLRALLSSRISRPKYQQLNPAVIYQDRFTTIEGNPNLIPAKSYLLELGANIAPYDIKVGYNYTIDPLSAAVFQGQTPSSYVLKAVNLSEQHSYYATLSFPISTKSWTSINTANISYNKLISEEIEFSSRATRPQVYFYSSNKFRVNSNLSLQLLGWYSGDKYDGLYSRAAQSSVSIGLEQHFFQKKLKFSFLADDIFKQNRPAGNYEVGATFVEFDRIFNTNYYRFILTYNFGKLNKKVYNNRSIGGSENSRAQ